MTNYSNNYLGLMSEMNRNSLDPQRFSMDVDDNSPEGYDENFDPPVPSIMECPICLLVLRDPVQTSCGHRFCKNCILKVIREGRKACPFDNEHLEENQIYPDNFAKREILNYTVHCRNLHKRNPGCEWLGPLSKLQEHLDNCLFASVGCTNGCGVEVLRNDLDKHLKEECIKRIETCEYCKIKVVHKDIEGHHSQCQEYPVFCPNDCPDPITRKFLEKHLQCVCPRAVILCPFQKLGCDFQGLREEVNEHFKVESLAHFGDLVQNFCSMKEALHKEVMPVKSLQRATNAELAQKFVELDGQVKDLIVNVHEATEKGDQGIQLAELYYSTQNSNISKLSENIKDLTARVENHEAAIAELRAKVWNGEFIWKINNFDKVFGQAASGEVPAIHSMPFYSRIPGYKMCLRVNLHGVDSGASTHISMFVHLMQGDFDTILPWPFSGKITLTAVDQSENEPLHVTETLVARPGLQAFLRPRASRNHKGYGYVEMISHSVLKTREYLKNNSLIIHVSVSSEQ